MTDLTRMGDENPGQQEILSPEATELKRQNSLARPSVGVTSLVRKSIQYVLPKSDPGQGARLTANFVKAAGNYMQGDWIGVGRAGVSAAEKAEILTPMMPKPSQAAALGRISRAAKWTGPVGHLINATVKTSNIVQENAPDMQFQLHNALLSDTLGGVATAATTSAVMGQIGGAAGSWGGPVGIAVGMAVGYAVAKGVNYAGDAYNQSLYSWEGNYFNDAQLNAVGIASQKYRTELGYKPDDKIDIASMNLGQLVRYSALLNEEKKGQKEAHDAKASYANQSENRLEYKKAATAKLYVDTIMQERMMEAVYDYRNGTIKDARLGELLADINKAQGHADNTPDTKAMRTSGPVSMRPESTPAQKAEARLATAWNNLAQERFGGNHEAARHFVTMLQSADLRIEALGIASRQFGQELGIKPGSSIHPERMDAAQLSRFSKLLNNHITQVKSGDKTAAQASGLSYEKAVAVKEYVDQLLEQKTVVASLSDRMGEKADSRLGQLLQDIDKAKADRDKTPDKPARRIPGALSMRRQKTPYELAESRVSQAVQHLADERFMGKKDVAEQFLHSLEAAESAQKLAQQRMERLEGNDDFKKIAAHAMQGYASEQARADDKKQLMELLQRDGKGTPQTNQLLAEQTLAVIERNGEHQRKMQALAMRVTHGNGFGSVSLSSLDAQNVVPHKQASEGIVR